MNIRLKTNQEEENLLIELQSKLQLSTKAAVMRLAIGFSLKKDTDPRIVDDILQKYDIKRQNGQEYLRLTILGSDDFLFKLMMEEHLQKSISDDEFFPELTYAHISRGIKLLNSEVRYAKNREEFFKKFIK